jgi:DNA-binding winged helix-turn-helix (wHTH) protein
MSSPLRPNTRFRFAAFVVSPSRRLLLEDGEPVTLIPRYFDLLVLLLARRNEAVHRRELLEAVWSDVVVSDGALNQAVRVLRRALGDDPRNPAFIRTVSRHGYRFIFPEVVEEPDDAPLASSEAAPAGTTATALDPEASFEAALERLLDPESDDNERSEAAEALHVMGADAALRRIGRRRGHARARAFLRDARWDVPGAGAVPIFGQPGSFAAASHLVAMRARRAVRIAGSRWAFSILGGAVSGLIGGTLGGLILRFGPGASPTDSVLVGLPAIGMTAGALAACGIGAGLAGAEAVARSMRGPTMILFAAIGGWLIGTLAHLFGVRALQSMFGGDLSALAGGFEGLVLGGAIGLGYALATPTTEGGMATPRGRARLLAAGLAGATCGTAAVVLASTGSYLGAMSLEFLARRFPGSDVGLGPLARLLGEAEPGVWTHALISGSEGFMLGFGLILGLTRRPR